MDDDVAVTTVQEAVTRVVRWAGRPDVRVALLGEAGRELSGNDVHLLRTVVAQGPVRASDLAAWQGVDKSTISTQIRRLEERGLVVRRPDPADRRAVLFTPTAAGRRLRRRMDAAGAMLFGELLRGWTDVDRQALATLLDRFSRQLDDQPTAGPMAAMRSDRAARRPGIGAT
jgi:DNA-binding MarR family transcriptional regulator